MRLVEMPTCRGGGGRRGGAPVRGSEHECGSWRCRPAEEGRGEGGQVLGEKVMRDSDANLQVRGRDQCRRVIQQGRDGAGSEGSEPISREAGHRGHPNNLFF